MTVWGTRPEAIKVAPLVLAIERSGVLDGITVVTGQHREMLDQVNAVFGIVPDHDLDVMSAGQSLSQVFARVLERLDEVLVAEAPDAVVVQGDTTTSTAAALAAFHRRIPVVHLEAGLRTGDLTSPFPEEANRVLTSRIAALHLAPTPTSRDNLLAEGVGASSVVVTGNTVIDALLQVVDQPVEHADPRVAAIAAAGPAGSPVLLVTTHRRESWGEPMRGIGRALGEIARTFPDVTVLLPAHRNPLVRDAVLPSVAGLANVVVTEPLAYAEFAHLTRRAHVVLTDSGGVQEEAPSLGKPVLVMRETTERPEAVTAGTVRLVGTDPARIVAEVSRLLTDPEAHAAMARATNPYGDGEAAARSVAAIEAMLGVGSRIAEFRG
jgi:UDP-N-acetylglucosamine 2-epimerase (non-hydrolysing)